MGECYCGLDPCWCRRDDRLRTHREALLAQVADLKERVDAIVAMLGPEAEMRARVAQLEGWYPDGWSHSGDRSVHVSCAVVMRNGARWVIWDGADMRRNSRGAFRRWASRESAIGAVEREYAAQRAREQANMQAAVDIVTGKTQSCGHPSSDLQGAGMTHFCRACERDAGRGDDAHPPGGTDDT